MNHEPDDELSLSPLTIDHLEQVLELENLCFSAPWSRQAYESELAENRLAHYCGVWRQERLLAYGGFWQILEEGHIANVGVHPEARRLGLGRALLINMMATCRALGGCRMTLEVREQNIPARRLYESLGFANAGLRPGYYENGENAVIMWVELGNF